MKTLCADTAEVHCQKPPEFARTVSADTVRCFFFGKKHILLSKKSFTENPVGCIIFYTGYYVKKGLYNIKWKKYVHF